MFYTKKTGSLILFCLSIIIAFLSSGFWIISLFNVFSRRGEIVFSNGQILAFSGLMLTAAAIFYGINSKTKEELKEDSKFYLENYKKLCDLIKETIILDTPTRRNVWVSSALYSKKLLLLEKNITDKAHKEIQLVDKRVHASFLNDFLYKKSPVYFYGVEANDLDEAASKAMVGYGKCSSERPELFYVDEEHIEAVFSSIKEIVFKDSNYLTRNGLLNADIFSDVFPCIYDYLSHKKLYKRGFNKNGQGLVRK